jgi:hypothetical protein
MITENTRFVNALREFLGKDPLPATEQAPEKGPAIFRHMGDGNFRSARASTDVAMPSHGKRSVL